MGDTVAKGAMPLNVPYTDAMCALRSKHCIRGHGTARAAAGSIIENARHCVRLSSPTPSLPPPNRPRVTAVAVLGAATKYSARRDAVPLLPCTAMGAGAAAGPGARAVDTSVQPPRTRRKVHRPCKDGVPPKYLWAWRQTAVRPLISSLLSFHDSPLPPTVVQLRRGSNE